MSPDGLSLNGAPPSAAVVAQLQARLGFELPLDDLRFWLLGIPNPDAAFELDSQRAGSRAAADPKRAGTSNTTEYRPKGAMSCPHAWC